MATSKIRFLIYATLVNKRGWPGTMNSGRGLESLAVADRREELCRVCGAADVVNSHSHQEKSASSNVYNSDLGYFRFSPHGVSTRCYSCAIEVKPRDEYDGGSVLAPRST